MNRALLDDKAKEYIEKINGINKENIKDVITVLEKIQRQIKVKESTKVFSNSEKTTIKINRNQLMIENDCITCEEFCNLKEHWIDRIIFFMISISEIENIEYNDMVIDYYISMWQNAYLNAAREKIKENAKPCLLFGPGYYGMDLEENEKFYNILEGKKFGLKMKKNIIYPGKINIGLFIKIKEEFKDEIKQKNPCKYCKGNRKYCETCFVDKTE